MSRVIAYFSIEKEKSIESEQECEKISSAGAATHVDDDDAVSSPDTDKLVQTIKAALENHSRNLHTELRQRRRGDKPKTLWKDPPMDGAASVVDSEKRQSAERQQAKLPDCDAPTN